jgi:hypothetical protein
VRVSQAGSPVWYPFLVNYPAQCLGVGSLPAKVYVRLERFSFLVLQNLPVGNKDSYLVDSASSHMLVSKIKPCMSKYKHLYRETANGSLNQLSFI